MAIFLDSASAADATEAAALGFIAGVTTNPALMAREAGRPEEIIAAICAAIAGPVFYQPVGAEPEEMERQVLAVAEAAPVGRLIAKIPCTLGGLALVRRLSPEMPCGVTAVFSAAQVYLAALAGARYALPYLNRMTRLGGDGAAVVERMALVIAGTGLELVVASIKSAEEVERALLAGAQHLTLPLAVIKESAEHSLSRQAIEEFERAARETAVGSRQ